MLSWWRSQNVDNLDNVTKGESSDDTIYPLHMLDQAPTLRSIVVTWTLRFDAVLSTETLTSSLEQLLTIRDWRKLGGRLKLKPDGQLEIHAPKSFTAERPALAFSRVNFDISINEHELSKHLPQATSEASIQKGPNKFTQFSSSPSAPSTLNDFVKADVPLMSLHITSFTDGTLLGFSWPHVLMDVMGQQAFIHSWSLVLAGRVAEVPPLLGAHEDALSRAAETEPVDQREFYQMQSKALSSLGKFTFGLRMGWDILWESCETRSIFLPHTAMLKLREQALKDIAQSDKGEAAAVSFLSDGDILTGWLAHIIASSLPSPRPLTILHAMNARFRVRAHKQAQETGTGVFVQNIAVPAFTLLSSHSSSATAGPIPTSAGSIALENRRQLTAQATEAQILAFVRDLEAQAPASRDPANMLAGEANALLVPFTDWSKADFFNSIDFSLAVVGKSNAVAKTAGRPTYFHASSMRPSLTMRNVVVIYGKIGDGEYWLNGTFTPTTWARVEKTIEEM